jgi:elongator complex protein 3
MLQLFSYIALNKTTIQRDMTKTRGLVIHGSLNSKYREACAELAAIIQQKSHISSREISKLIKEISGRYQLSTIPKYTDIMSHMPSNDKNRKMLIRKPTKSASGVIVVAIMAKPFDCPHGKCIYCPGGVEFNTPLSYTGKEPVTKKAQEVDYDARLQIISKLDRYLMMGHDISKVELVIVGGTFPFMPLEYQSQFVKQCYDALNGDRALSDTLTEAKALNETSKSRCVGFTVETKPDYCKSRHIDIMLDLGITRIEIGVQTLDNAMYKMVNRGHTLVDVFEAFHVAKESGYKIVAHMMPGLPGSTVDKDLQDFRTLFEDPRLMPDMLKIYPTLVLKNTGLYRLYQKGSYCSFSEEEFVNLLVEIKRITPSWVRIMRIQREIDPDDIVSGPKSGNIRQLLQMRLKEMGIKCNCIRCREAGLRRLKQSNVNPVLKRTDYVSSNGIESFLSLEDGATSSLFGFLRLRKLNNPHREELRTSYGEASAVVRELHVFGQLIDIGKKCDSTSFQHRGHGSRLLKEAEDIVKYDFGLDKISILSSVGTRDYYRKFNYHLDGPYMSKTL